MKASSEAAIGPYRSGRGGDWLKIKCIQSESFVIIGYEPSTIALGGIGRLLLAACNGSELSMRAASELA